MRPCAKCGKPIENRQAVCPVCGTPAAFGPKATPGDDPPSAPGPVGLLFGSTVPDLISLVRFIVPAGVPLSLGGWIGYAVAGAEGAVCGVLIAMALAIGVRAWAESGG